MKSIITARSAALGAALALGVFVTSAPLAPPTQARGAPESFSNLAETLSPSVVNISTTQKVQARGGLSPDFEFPPGSPFEEFFKQFGGPEGSQRRVNSLGSGFVIDAEGIIVTNNHVIDGAEEIQVNFDDGTSLEAEVVGTDELSDLAVLRVKPAKPLKAVQFGDSDSAKVGDWVVAIGNPFGLGGTVTAGIISAFNRDIQAGPYDDFIQTDAAINRGNSGGPLFDLGGNVVGVNTAIISPTGGSIGIGFAIPSAIAKRVVDQLLEYGETRRGWIGVRIQSVSDEIAEGLGIDEARGALVAGVTGGGPADKAGLEIGDLIVSFNKQEVKSVRELPRIVADTDIGSSVDVKVLRDGKEKTFRIKPGQLDEERRKATLSGGSVTDEEDDEKTSSGEAVLGLELSNVTSGLRRKFRLSEDARGVIVTNVDADSPAAGTVRTGDIITEVGQEPVKSPKDVETRVKQEKDKGKKSVLLTVERGGVTSFLGVRLSEGS